VTKNDPKMVKKGPKMAKKGPKMAKKGQKNQKNVTFFPKIIGPKSRQKV